MRTDMKRSQAAKILQTMHEKGVPLTVIANALGYQSHRDVSPWVNGHYLPSHSTASVILAVDWPGVIKNWRDTENAKQHALDTINDLISASYTRNDIAVWAGISNSLIYNAVATGQISQRTADKINKTKGMPTYGDSAVRSMLLEEYPHMLACYDGDAEKAVRRLADAYSEYGSSPLQVANWLAKNGHDIDTTRFKAERYQEKRRKNAA